MNLPSYHRRYIACLEGDVIRVYQRRSSQWAHRLYAGGEVENCDQVRTAGSHGYPGCSPTGVGSVPGVGSDHPCPHHSNGPMGHRRVPRHQMMGGFPG